MLLCCFVCLSASGLLPASIFLFLATTVIQLHERFPMPLKSNTENEETVLIKARWIADANETVLDICILCKSRVE